MNDEQAVVVEPALGKPEQALAVIGASEFLTQHPDEGASVMIGEPLKPERIAGDLLALNRCWCPTLHRAATRGQVLRRPRARRNAARAAAGDPNRVEEPAAHPQKADLQSEPALELRPTAVLGDPGLLGRELEEHLDLEGRQLARQVPQTKKRRVPAVHSAPPNRRTIDPCKARSASR